MTTRHFRTPFFLALLSLLTLAACKSETKHSDSMEEQALEAVAPVVEVVTRSMEFYAPDTLPSGWNHIAYKNQSTEPHFILLDKYPEGKSIADTRAEVLPPFDEGMALIMEGKGEAAMAAFGKLPAWFSEIVYYGGTGLISPGGTARSTVKLDPGYYIMECYVKMPDGSWHTSMGMAKELIVKDEDSNLTPPEATVSVSVSGSEGYNMTGNPVAGKNVFAVTYADQMVHENFVGHDLNLVRLDGDTDEDALEVWMNWSVPNGLMSSTVPEGVTFLGGANDAPAGTTHYFEAELTPGRYAFIAEVPDTRKKNLFLSFIVGE